jgi:putative iron-regulated protein
MKKLTFLLAITLIVSACSNDDENNNNNPQNTITKAAVIANYADLVYQSYADTYQLALTMQTAINTFVDTPSAANLTAAKNAWLAAREPYGQTEAYRECNGPIDTDNSSSTPWGLGNEGQMNAWPIDEGYIDYVQAGTEPYAGTYTSIISDATITINEATIAAKNEDVDDKSISTGWHAIEFLLWGQDNSVPSVNQAGLRDFTDYTTASDATRRGQYLKAVTTILINDLSDLVNTWNTGGTYRTVFEALDEDVALRQLINGAFFIAGDELSSERMIAPVDSTDGIDNSGQEDEHSCFSDNTNRDVYANAQGVYNVVFGQFGSVNGASFYDLVNQADATQAASLLTAANNAMAKVNVIGNSATPFDDLITSETSTDANLGPVMEAVQALFTLGDEISASAAVIGINLQ